MAVLNVDSLPLGFRFRPTDEELINHYLTLKINGRDSEIKVIPEVDVCKWEPWDLPGLSVIKNDDPEWFFFCPLDRKYPNGHRSNRATSAGYWKATGKDRTIKTRKPNQRCIGMKKTLVFYRGRAPKGQRTNWIMHEYRPTDKDLDGTAPGQSAFVLFRLFRKPEEKFDIPKSEDVELNESSPVTSKLSPDDTSSVLLQKTETSEMQVREHSEDTNRGLCNSTYVTPNTLVAVESYSNSCTVSDGENHKAHMTAMNAYLPVDGNSGAYNNVLGQIDCKVFSPTQLPVQRETKQYYYMSSPYANDFGHDQDGLDFVDIDEQGVSFDDLFDEFFTNHDEVSHEESQNQKKFDVANGTQLRDHERASGTAPPEHLINSNNVGISYTNEEVIKLQHNQGVLEIPAALSSWSFLGDQNNGNISKPGKTSAGEESSFTYSIVGSSYDIEASSAYSAVGSSSDITNVEESTYTTRIQMETLATQQQFDENNFGNQGTAERRLRLQMKCSIGSCMDENNIANVDYAFSGHSKMKKDSEQTAKSEESYNKGLKLRNSEKTDDASDTGIKIRSRSKTDYNSAYSIGSSPQKIYMKNRDLGSVEDQDESIKGAEHGATFEESEMLWKLNSNCKENTRDNFVEKSGELRGLVKKAGVVNHGGRLSLVVCVGSILVMIVVCMVYPSIGVWICG